MSGRRGNTLTGNVRAAQVGSVAFLGAGLLFYVMFAIGIILRQLPLVIVGAAGGFFLAFVGERLWRLAVLRSHAIPTTQPDRETSEDSDAPGRPQDRSSGRKSV